MAIAYFDAHCDTISVLRESGEGLYSNTRHVALDRAAAYGHYVQFFAAFADMAAAYRKDYKTHEDFLALARRRDLTPPPDFAENFWAMKRVFDAQMAENAAYILPCRTTADIDAARAAGKAAAVLTVEDAEQLETVGLDAAHAAGVRAITLTWNYHNFVGGTNLSGGGITEQGRAFVDRMQELGILVDISHASEQLFWDVAARMRGPFIATHSNARKLCTHRRNLTDEQFWAICASGGVAGINFYADFVRDGGVCTLEDLADHIQHFISLGGAKHIALGGDLDGCDALPEGLTGVQDAVKLADVLARRGLSASLIEDIFYNNLYRVAGEVWK